MVELEVLLRLRVNGYVEVGVCEVDRGDQFVLSERSSYGLWGLHLERVKFSTFTPVGSFPW